MNYSNSLKSIIFRFVKGKYPDWVHKGIIGRYAIGAGYENENAGRRCRELLKDGYLEVRYTKNLSGVKCAEYRYKPPVVVQQTPEERTKELAQMGIF